MQLVTVLHTKLHECKSERVNGHSIDRSSGLYREVAYLRTKFVSHIRPTCLANSCNQAFSSGSNPPSWSNSFVNTRSKFSNYGRSAGSKSWLPTLGTASANSTVYRYSGQSAPVSIRQILLINWPEPTIAHSWVFSLNACPLMLNPFHRNLRPMSKVAGNRPLPIAKFRRGASEWNHQAEWARASCHDF